MAIIIPAGGSFQNSARPWLTSQILVDINLEDFKKVTIPIFLESDITPEVTLYDRVVNAEIQLIYIDESKVLAQLEKVLNTVTTALTSDLNPVVRSVEGHLSSTEAGINPMNFQFGLQIDNTQEIRYISVWIQCQKLKVDYVTQAFETVKAYVVTALLP